MGKQSKGPGRPKIPEKKRRKNVVGIRLQPHERKALEDAAAAAGEKLSTWARKKLLDL